MRITKVLCQLNYLKYFRRLWKKQSSQQIPDLIIPPDLQKMNVKIEDAKDVFLETMLFEPEVPIPKIRYKARSVFLNEENIFFLMNEKVRVSENENQALALTKTVCYSGLPDVINSLLDVENVPNQDDIIQTFILQSFILDSIQSKLPKKLDITKPGWNFPREFGILKKRKSSNLMEKISIHCDSVIGKYADSLKMKKILNAFSEVSIKRGRDNVVFQMPCDILLTSKKPLKCFASPHQVDETETLEVPNIYPIKPTLDLDKCETNPAKWIKIPDAPNNSFIHTLLLAQKAITFWFPKQMLARAIATCFSFAATEARRRFGDDVKILPEPISVHCAFMDLKNFNHIAYQLNTLDVLHEDGIKNQVWIDEPSDLYSEITEMNEIKDYNKNVVSKILAFHLNGLHPISL